MFDTIEQKPDKKLLLAILALTLFGWIMSSSASVGHFGTFSFAFKQGVFILLGIVTGVVILRLPLSFFKRHSLLAFGITLFLLFLVFLPDIGAGKINGAYRWIDLGIFNFQPSEMMKMVMILFMANFLVEQEEYITKSLKGLFKAIFIISLSGALTIAETDLGATIIITATALIMVFIAGSYVKELLYIGTIILFGLSIFVYFNPARWGRVISFWTNDLWGKDGVYQTKQALLGIARGDWFGTGLGSGIQKYTKLPEPHTDMIFAITGEELGIVGMLFILLSFAYILTKGFKIAAKASKDGRKYSYYVAYGICSWFAMQISVNIAMNIGLMPIKGFTLPLISYGGSSMIFTITALALLLRIDMENRAGYSKRKSYV
jgi:cell division protein FtsW